MLVGLGEIEGGGSGGRRGGGAKVILTEKIPGAPKDESFGGTGSKRAIVPRKLPDLLSLPPDVVNQDADGDEQEQE